MVEKHYLYRHIRLDTNKPFYIGIGTHSCRMFYRRAHQVARRNNHWRNVVSKTNFEVEILLESNDYEFIKQKEIEFISLYGRSDLGKGTLVNKTNGGDGNVGMIVKESTREKLRRIQSGKKLSQETIEKCRKSNKAKGATHANSIKVINYETKEIFISIREAAKSVNMQPKTLSRKLNGMYINTTDFCYLEDYNVTFFGNVSREKATTGTKVQNTITGEVFNSISKAADSIGMKQFTLSARIRIGSKKYPIFKILETREILN